MAAPNSADSLLANDVGTFAPYRSETVPKAFAECMDGSIDICIAIVHILRARDTRQKRQLTLVGTLKREDDQKGNALRLSPAGELQAQWIS